MEVLSHGGTPGERLSVRDRIDPRVFQQLSGGRSQLDVHPQTLVKEVQGHGGGLGGGIWRSGMGSQVKVPGSWAKPGNAYTCCSNRPILAGIVKSVQDHASLVTRLSEYRFMLQHNKVL